VPALFAPFKALAAAFNMIKEIKVPNFDVDCALRTLLSNTKADFLKYEYSRYRNENWRSFTVYV
jgi:hypothetical protein